jgi:hypothetical protein
VTVDLLVEPYFGFGSLCLRGQRILPKVNPSKVGL